MHKKERLSRNVDNTYLVVLAACAFLAVAPACGPYMGDDLTGVGDMHTQGTGPSGETTGGPGQGTGVTSTGGTTMHATTTTTGGSTATTGGATTTRGTTTGGGYSTTTTGGGYTTTTTGAGATTTGTGGYTTTTTGAGGTATTTTGGGYGTTTGGGYTTTTGGGTTGTTTGGYTCGGTWQSFAGNFFSQFCASCHSSEGSEGIAYFDGMSYSSVAQNANSIWTAIENGSMPGGSQLTDQQKNDITTWLHCNPPPQW